MVIHGKDQVENGKYSKLTVKFQKYFWYEMQHQRKVWWKPASFVVIAATLGTVRTILKLGFRKVKVHNITNFKNHLSGDKSKAPLITYSNHISTIDDPVLWGILPRFIRHSPTKMRWVLGAKELTMINPFLVAFFSLGKVIPTIRGNGIYQSSMDFAISRINKCEWIHVFPEAKVNQEKELLRFKWGISRLIMESERPPIVIPIYHEGLQKVFPLNMPIKYLRINPFETTMSVKFGEPIDFGEVLGRWKAELNTSTVLGKDSDGTGVIDIARLSTETGSVIDEINKKYRIEIANILAEKLVQLGSNMRVNEYDSGDRW